MINNTPTRPAVPERVRDVAYFALLAASVACAGLYLVAPIWAGAELAGKLQDTAQAVLVVLGLIAGGLGVAYRPGLTRPPA